MSRPFIFAVCGRKNTGKTTLMGKLIRRFADKGLCVAALKHDGHEFEADREDTDSYSFAKAGAYGTAVFSAQKYMAVKYSAGIGPEELAELFPEADLILLEGMKGSPYPKIETIMDYRDICADVEGLIGAVVSEKTEDLCEKLLNQGLKVWDYTEVEEVCTEIEAQRILWEERNQ